MHHLKILNLDRRFFYILNLIDQRFEVEETELLMDGLKQCQELEELYLSCILIYNYYLKRLSNW